jgi:hypothetical protein
MKSKPNLQQMLSLIFVSCLILISWNGSNKPKSGKVYLLKSERIDKAGAIKLRNLYKSEDILKTVNSHGNEVKLRRFSFDASEMNEIINKNAYFPPNSPGKVDKVDLRFGSETVPGHKIDRLHIIAYGMTYSAANGGMLLEKSYNNGSPSIYDKIIQTAPITKRLADDLHNFYDNNNYLTTIDKTGNEVKLEALSFDAWQIQEILTNNASGKTPDKVVFYLGTEIVKSHKIHRWHIIAYGMKGNELLDYSTAKSSSKKTGRAPKIAAAPSIFDKADPCPPCN